MSRIAVIGIAGNSVFLPVSEFHVGGETVEASSVHFEPGGKGFNQAVAAKRSGGVVSFFAAVGKMKNKFLVDTFAMRCWPEFIADELYGIVVCSTIGHLTNHGYTTACEGDVYGAVMMQIGKSISGDMPFFCDLIIAEGEYGVAWHCGAAPCQLCKPGCHEELRCSSTVDGGGVKGVTGEFPLKPGRVTLARLGEKRDGDGFRMLIATGEAIDTDMFVRGNPLKIRFDAGCDKVRETIINEGWEHHYVLTYGDFVPDLLDLCRMLNVEVTLVQ